VLTISLIYKSGLSCHGQLHDTRIMIFQFLGYNALYASVHELELKSFSPLYLVSIL